METGECVCVVGLRLFFFNRAVCVCLSDQRLQALLSFRKSGMSKSGLFLVLACLNSQIFYNSDFVLFLNSCNMNCAFGLNQVCLS